MGLLLEKRKKKKYVCGWYSQVPKTFFNLSMVQNCLRSLHCWQSLQPSKTSKMHVFEERVQVNILLKYSVIVFVSLKWMQKINCSFDVALLWVEPQLQPTASMWVKNPKSKENIINNWIYFQRRKYIYIRSVFLNVPAWPHILIMQIQIVFLSSTSVESAATFKGPCRGFLQTNNSVYIQYFSIIEHLQSWYIHNWALFTLMFACHCISWHICASLFVCMVQTNQRPACKKVAS